MAPACNFIRMLVLGTASLADLNPQLYVGGTGLGWLEALV
jgi:hypothetical protein